MLSEDRSRRWELNSRNWKRKSQTDYIPKQPVLWHTTATVTCKYWLFPMVIPLSQQLMSVCLKAWKTGLYIVCSEQWAAVLKPQRTQSSVMKQWLSVAARTLPPLTKVQRVKYLLKRSVCPPPRPAYSIRAEMSLSSTCRLWYEWTWDLRRFFSNCIITEKSCADYTPTCLLLVLSPIPLYTDHLNLPRAVAKTRRTPITRATSRGALLQVSPTSRHRASARLPLLGRGGIASRWHMSG